MFGPALRRTRPFLRVNSLWLVLVLTLPAAPAVFASDLDSFNPATTDPSKFRIAVRHSERLAVPQGGARVKILMTDRQTGQVLREKEVLLKKAVQPNRLESVLSERRTDEQVSVYRIPEQEVAELRALQAKYLSLPQTRKDNMAGSLTIDVAGCKLDPEDNGRMLISTYLKTSEFQDYVPLEMDFDLRNVPDTGKTGRRDPVQPCQAMN
ncbi:hypothetical protein [Labrenzia sp. VG12]|uniref:hypothetical protein n=1 Tax=Labrenzia sp. VG12 TaxID=2021862 RepID=UPI0012FE0DA8|nr:hypothetical protein [Labrenzia sp. VG12]